MKVWIRTPYSIEKNLGQVYNYEMAMIPEGDAACFIDGDVMFLTPNYGHILYKYANAYPDAVLTCWTNRIHHLANRQRMPDGDDHDVKSMLRIEQGFTDVTEITGSVSGFLMVVPKHIWRRYPFGLTNKFNPERPNLLGCDNEWTNRIRANGVKILRMNGLYVWHTYRLLSNGQDKSHLL